MAPEVVTAVTVLLPGFAIQIVPCPSIASAEGDARPVTPVNVPTPAGVKTLSADVPASATHALPPGSIAIADGVLSPPPL